MPTDVHVVVVDEGLYQGNGVVARWMRGIGHQLYANIVLVTPERTGRLRAGLRRTDQRLGVRILSTAVESTAAHTGYVIHGTAQNGVGLIYSTRGWRNRATVGRIRSGQFVSDLPRGLWMVLSDARGGRHLVVHGQRQNNFLAKGYNNTAKTHRALKPISRGMFT
jgi:hypothetical protein